MRNVYSINKIKPTGVKPVDDLTKVVSANVIDLTKEVKKIEIGASKEL